MTFNDTDLLSQAGSVENILKFDDIEPVLESRDLSVSYGGQTAVSGVSLQVPKNSVVSLIGPSG